MRRGAVAAALLAVLLVVGAPARAAGRAEADPRKAAEAEERAAMSALEAATVANRRAQEALQWTGEMADRARQGLEQATEAYQRAHDAVTLLAGGYTVGTEFRDCPDCPEMVVVPGGGFTMGSPAGEAEHQDNEGPAHPVTIAQAFAIGKYPVTFAEWDACVEAGGCNRYHPADNGWGRRRRPAIFISWQDAQSYLAWLRRKTGKPYRLPSEAEREYVTRAGTTTPFWFGAAITTDDANYNGTYAYGGGAVGQFRARTVEVGTVGRANPFGLWDVHGNVLDWVEDCWHEHYTGAPADGSAWVAPRCDSRVLRGGTWTYVPGNLRAAFRYIYPPGYRSEFTGFRVVRTLLR